MEADQTTVHRPPRIFVSYRVADSIDVVAPLAASLREDLGATNVFRDRDSLIGGQRWQEALDGSVRSADVALCLVGADWTGDHDGSRRIDAADDPVRREVALALESQVTPVPILVDREHAPTGLPQDIEGLLKHHALRSSSSALASPDSPEYQQVLVSVWEAMRSKSMNGVLVLTEAEIDLGALVQTLQESKTVDARKLTRLAAGAHLVPARRLRRWARKCPDVIVISDGEPSETLRSRIAAAARHPALHRMAFLGTGVAAGVAIAAASSADLSVTAHTSAGELASLTSSNSVGLGRAAAARFAGAALGTKAAVGIGVAAIGVGAVAGNPFGGGFETGQTVRYGYLDITLDSVEVFEAVDEEAEIDPTTADLHDSVEDRVGVSPALLESGEQLVIVGLTIDELSDSIEWRIDTSNMFFLRFGADLYDAARNLRLDVVPERSTEVEIPFAVPASWDLEQSDLIVQQHARDPARRLREATLGFDGSASESLDEVTAEVLPHQLDLQGSCSEPASRLDLTEVIVGDEPGYLAREQTVWTNRNRAHFEYLAVPRAGTKFVTIVAEARRFTICGSIGDISFHQPVLFDADGTAREPVSGIGSRWRDWGLEPSLYVWTFEVDEDLDTFEFEIPSFDLAFSARI